MESSGRSKQFRKFPLINDLLNAASSSTKNSPLKRSKTLGRREAKNSRDKRRGSAEGLLESDGILNAEPEQNGGPVTSRRALSRDSSPAAFRMPNNKPVFAWANNRPYLRGDVDKVNTGEKEQVSNNHNPVRQDPNKQISNNRNPVHQDPNKPVSRDPNALVYKTLDWSALRRMEASPAVNTNRTGPNKPNSTGTSRPDPPPYHQHHRPHQPQGSSVQNEERTTSTFPRRKNTAANKPEIAKRPALPITAINSTTNSAINSHQNRHNKSSLTGPGAVRKNNYALPHPHPHHNRHVTTPPSYYQHNNASQSTTSTSTTPRSRPGAAEDYKQFHHHHNHPKFAIAPEDLQGYNPDHGGEKPRPKSLDGVLESSSQSIRSGSGVHAATQTAETSRSCEDFGASPPKRYFERPPQRSASAGFETTQKCGLRELNAAISALLGVMGGEEGAGGVSFEEEEEEEEDWDGEEQEECCLKKKYEDECDAILESEDEDHANKFLKAEDAKNEELSVLCNDVISHLDGLLNSKQSKESMKQTKENTEQNLESISTEPNSNTVHPKEDNTNTSMDSDSTHRLSNDSLNPSCKTDLVNYSSSDSCCSNNLGFKPSTKDLSMKSNNNGSLLDQVQNGENGENGHEKNGGERKEEKGRNSNRENDSNGHVNGDRNERNNGSENGQTTCANEPTFSSKSSKCSDETDKNSSEDALLRDQTPAKSLADNKSQESSAVPDPATPNSGLRNEIRNPCFRYQSQTLPERTSTIDRKTQKKSKHETDKKNDNVDDNNDKEFEVAEYTPPSLCNSNHAVNFDSNDSSNERLTKWNPRLDLTTVSTDDLSHQESDKTKSGKSVIKTSATSSDDDDDDDDTEVEDESDNSDDRNVDSVTRNNGATNRNRNPNTNDTKETHPNQNARNENGSHYQINTKTNGDSCKGKPPKSPNVNKDTENGGERKKMKVKAVRPALLSVNRNPQNGGVSSTGSSPGGARPSGTNDPRPKSFLREEVDEFEEIFNQLFSGPAATAFVMGNDLPTAMTSPDRNDPANNSRQGSSGGMLEPGMRQSLHEELFDKFCSETGSFGGMSELGPFRSRLRSPLAGGADGVEGEKLFSDLLDDLDNISRTHTDSARRRKKARQIFSDWLFNSDDATNAGANAGAAGACGGRNSPAQHHHTTTTQQQHHHHQHHAGGRMPSPEQLQQQQQQQPPTRRRKSHGEQPSGLRSDLYSKWRPRSFEYLSEDDSDSGYHTGNSTLVGRGGVGISKPKGEYTLTREELRKNIEKFNNNAHGLIMNIESDSNMFEGFIRVHMNLIRPINMSLTARPPSIYEVLAHEEPEPESPVDTNTQIASFYLPKDTTKVIHIQSNTSTQEVIKALLTKFRITDNPRKFALYDKYEEPGQKPIMRKLVDDEMPLPLCLSWRAEAEDGLDTHRFILQENDAGEILWDAFSIPELENFVRMLDREEQEYLDQVRAKYKLMKIHMDRRMNEIQEAEQKQREQQSTETQAETDSKEESNQDKEDKREPVFV